MPTPLVRATAVTPTRVENRDSGAVGQVAEFAVDPASGQARFAVLSLGGFLGFNKSFYPVPFALLQFDPVRDVYVIPLDRKRLEGGPSWANTAPAFDDDYAAGVTRYYAGATA